MTTTSMRRLEAAALQHAGNGYHVFPVRPRAKTPMTGNGFKSATREERSILHWWDRNPDANIGIACGASGVAVLDIDSKHGANPDDILDGRDLNGAPVIRTGEAPARDKQHPDSLPGVRGAQVYFRGDLATGPLTLDGCEIRGAGAYVVAPPSIHPSGVHYLGDLPAVDRLPPIPDWLRALTSRGRTAGPATAVTDVIPPGRRNGELASIAGTMRRRGMSAAEIAGALHVTNRDRCQPPLPPDEVEAIAHSIARYKPAEAVQASKTAVLTQTGAREATRSLEALLTLDQAGITIRGARVYGKGSGAQVEIDLSNGETMTFGALRDMMRPQTLIGELGATAEVNPTLKQHQCAEAMVLTKKLGQFVPIDGENDVAREWGRDFLDLAEIIDADMNNQAERWRAFELLKDRERWGKPDERDQVNGGPLVLRHLDGALFVRTIWFERYVKARDGGVSRLAIGGRMARVGWERRGKTGDIKATRTGPGFPKVRIYPFWIIPATWLADLEARHAE